MLDEGPEAVGGKRNHEEHSDRRGASQGTCQRQMGHYCRVSSNNTSTSADEGQDGGTEETKEAMNGEP